MIAAEEKAAQSMWVTVCGLACHVPPRLASHVLLLFIAPFDILLSIKTVSS